MKELITLLFGSIGVLIYGMALGAPPQAEGPNVTVVNTPSNSVPVSGDVRVIGGVNVTVTNDTTPVQKCVVFTLDVDDHLSRIYTVPQGQRLTVEYLSCEATSLPPSVAMMFSLKTTTNGETADHFLPIGPIAPSPTADRG